MQHSHKINTLEAFALSLATMAPTGSLAGNAGPTAKFAGINLPLSFLVAAVAMSLVAIGFYEMSKLIAANGSVYAYNRKSLGEHWGFVSGWILTLGYIVFSAGMNAQLGNYASLIFKELGFNVSPVLIGFILIILIAIILSHGIKITSNVSLVTEIIALTILMILSFTILGKGGANGLNVKPFIPKTSLSGIASGVVYTVMCFVGFEVSCTVATRTKNPKHSIPFALMSTIIGGAIIFVFVSYTIVMGFGTNHINALVNSPAPLSTLAGRFMGPGMTIIINFAIFISALGGTICVTNAAAYMLFALGQKNYLPHFLGNFNYRHNAPRHSILLVMITSLILYTSVAVTNGINTTYLYYITLGALCMIVIYLFSCISSFTFFKRHQEFHHSIFKHDLAPICGFIVLLFPLISNIYPVPKFPLNLFPYFILAWGIAGYIMSIHHTKKN